MAGYTNAPSLTQTSGNKAFYAKHNFSTASTIAAVISSGTYAYT